MVRFISATLVLLLVAAAGLEARQLTPNQPVVLDQERILSLPSSVQTSLRSAGSAMDQSETVVRWFASQGYLDARVDSVSDRTETRHIYAVRGCRYTLEALQLQVKDDPGLTLREGRWLGTAFTADLIPAIAAELLQDVEEEGYLLAAFEVQSVERHAGSCSVHLHAAIDLGDTFEAGSVRVIGAERTGMEYLQRVTGIRSGEIITPALMDRGRRNLIHTELFEDVSEGELVFVNDDPAVQYEVQEQQMNFFDGMFGLVPDASGSARFAGFGDILLRNALADGNRLNLRFEQLQPFVTKLDVRAEQDIAGGFPVRLGGGLHFVQQDSTYLTRSFDLQAAYRLFTGFELIGTIRADRSSVSDVQGRELAGFDSRATFFGGGFRLRQLDRVLVPTRGYDLRVLLETGRRFITDTRFDDSRDRNFRQTRLNGSVRGFLPVTRRTILAPRAVVQVLESPQFLITDLFRFGGASSLRGYREDQFRASQVVWGDFEVRRMIERNSYLFLFGAYGLFERPQLITEPTAQLSGTESLQSFGGGLTFQSPLGLITFSYAISPDDDISNGKVHVGISTGL
ncbi:MAG: BamA/TamA family outer membrane protein [Balneolaceae bacterium]